ncbi:MAG TPA: HlyD family type I secretion periplasmic adaptor subunit [Bacillus bacterium]|nr:HlyD family type I secretion periplasmic adaptor subunit [Bacillus sp. (in: firmicutes)]
MEIEKQRVSDEYDFLPGALEIIETPPSPLGRFLIWMIFTVFISFIVWSYFGKIDEVAVARGKVIPDGRLKVIQPLEEGIITAIHIKEGEKVKKDQLLLELDASMKQADITSLENSLQMAILEKNLISAELNGTISNKEIEKTKLNNLNASQVVELQKKYSQAKSEEYIAQKETLQTIIQQREKDVQLAITKLDSVKSHYSYISSEVDNLKSLYENGGIPKIELKKKEEELLLSQKEVDSQTVLIEKLNSELKEAQANLISLTKMYEKDLATKDKELADKLVVKEKEIIALEDQLSKAKKILKYQKLVSPVDGVVQGIASQTIGGVVTPAQPVVTIVPEGTPLIVEANVLNKDIGFIEVGQLVDVKFDTFPFQKYGVIKGKVLSISPDAVEDEKIGLVYNIKVELEENTFTIRNKEVNISSGMTVSAEVKTGKRRIIEFFLSPILKNLKESLTLR